MTTRAKLRSLVAVLACAGAAPLLATGSATWTLESVLKQLDKAISRFEGAVAEVELTAVDAAGAEPRTGSGKAYFDRGGAVRFDLSSPDEETLLSTGPELYVYEPARAIVEQFAVAKHPERLEPYASLGFSLTGKGLEKNYVVSLLGEESIDDHKTLVLELTPRSDEMRAAVSRIQLWIGEAAWLPVQQKIFHGGAETYLSARYRNVSKDVPLEDSLFKPKWPKGTETVKR
jgi:outer membrane lipoprotein-sorting protein